MDINERQKQELAILQKDYEILCKTYDEQVKLFYGVPPFAAASLGLLAKSEIMSIKIWNDVNLFLILLCCGVFFITLLWGRISYEIEKLDIYRARLEERINSYFTKELLSYGSKYQRIKSNSGFRNIFIIIVLVGISLLIFPSNINIRISFISYIVVYAFLYWCRNKARRDIA